jgi:outer membrane lipoprotein SlyB
LGFYEGDVMKTLLISLCLMVVLAVSGCASSLSGSAYSRDQARQVQTVREGAVVDVRPVNIEGTKSGVGAISGGVLGGAVGQTIGGGTGRILATGVGAVGGAIAGSVAEEGVTRQEGLEITVKLDSGETLAIVQASDEYFGIGDRVKVLQGHDGARVTH